MKKVPHTVRNVSIMLVLLCLAFLISLLFQQVFDVEEHITTLLCICCIFNFSFDRRICLWYDCGGCECIGGELCFYISIFCV